MIRLGLAHPFYMSNSIWGHTCNPRWSGPAAHCSMPRAWYVDRINRTLKNTVANWTHRPWPPTTVAEQIEPTGHGYLPLLLSCCCFFKFCRVDKMKRLVFIFHIWKKNNGSAYIKIFLQIFNIKITNFFKEYFNFLKKLNVYTDFAIRKYYQIL